MFINFIKSLLKKEPVKPSKTYHQSDYSWNIQLDREEYKGTIGGYSPKTLKKGDHLVLFTDDKAGRGLFKVISIKTVIEKTKNSLGPFEIYGWKANIKWVPSGMCPMCKKFIEFENHEPLFECPKCKVELV